MGDDHPPLAVVEKDAPEVLSVQRAGQRLGIDPRRLREAIRTGDLEAYRPGTRACYVRWSDVLRWLRGQRLPSINLARERVREILADEARKRPS